MALYGLVKEGKIDTWDLQWNYAVVANRGLSIIPVRSMVTNIGVGEDATHTKRMRREIGKAAGEKISFPLRHPRLINVSFKYDRTYFVNVVKTITPISRLILKRWCPKMVYAVLRKWTS